MEHQARLQNIRAVSIFERLLRCVTKTKGTLQSLTDLGKCLANRISLTPLLSFARTIDLRYLS
jgi:hypothetical protein